MSQPRHPNPSRDRALPHSTSHPKRDPRRNATAPPGRARLLPSRSRRTTCCRRPSAGFAGGPTVQGLILAFLVISPVHADRIDLPDATLQGIHIVDLDGARIAYRTPAGELRFAPIAQAELIQFDNLPELSEFNEAERLIRRGNFDKAVPRYERAARVAQPRWLPLIRARIIQACDRLGDVDKLVIHFIALLDDEAAGAPLAAELLPALDNVDPLPKSRRAIERLEARMEHAASQSARVLLELLRFIIVHQPNHSEAPALAELVIRQPIPLMVATRPAYRARAAAIQRWADGGHPEAALRELDADLRSAPEPVLPELLLAKARVSLAIAGDRESLIRAAWPAMRIVIHRPDDTLAPQALLLAADVHQRIGQAPTAIQLLDECLQHPRIAPTTHQRALNERNRLTSTTHGGP